MTAARETRSPSWWIAIGLFAIAMLLIGSVLALAIWALATNWAEGDPLAEALVAGLTLLGLYVAVVAFLVSVLIRPHRVRALWFAGAVGLLLILLWFSLAEGTPMLRLWPIYQPLHP